MADEVVELDAGLALDAAVVHQLDGVTDEDSLEEGVVASGPFVAENAAFGDARMGDGVEGGFQGVVAVELLAGVAVEQVGGPEERSLIVVCFLTSPVPIGSR